METSIYSVNKGVNRPVEFKGLKAQYIWILAGGIVGLLFLFSVLYFAGLNTFFIIGIVLVIGGVLFKTIYKYSNTYGEHGLKKKLAQRKVPSVIRCNSRAIFFIGKQ